MYREFALAAAVGGILLAGGNEGVRTAGNDVVIGEQMAAPVAQDPGEAVFRGKGNCATCHGRDARGTPLGPDLTDGVWLHGSGTLAEITGIVRDGVVKPKQFPAPMPAMGGARLRPAEIEAVARYVLNLNPVAAPPTGER
jgi:cbb3-type cytochrome c oxidase subunit III